MLRSLTIVWGLGATFFLIVLLTTSVPSGSRPTLAAIDAVGFAVLAILLVGRERPRRGHATSAASYSQSSWAG